MKRARRRALATHVHAGVNVTPTKVQIFDIYPHKGRVQVCLCSEALFARVSHARIGSIIRSYSEDPAFDPGSSGHESRTVEFLFFVQPHHVFCPWRTGPRPPAGVERRPRVPNGGSSFFLSSLTTTFCPWRTRPPAGVERVAATSPERWSSFFLSSLTTGGQNRVGVVFTSSRLRTVGVKGATTRASSRALPRRNRRRLRKTPQRRLFLDSPTLGVRRRRSTRRWTRARRLFRSRRVRERQPPFFLLIVCFYYNKKCPRYEQKQVARDGARNKTGRKQ